MNDGLLWLGDGGKPVVNALAEERGRTCEICTKNTAPLWWERMVKDPIAGFIRKWLAKKHEMNLELSMEKDLHMCSVCGCCTRLKCWEPIEYIQAHPHPPNKAYPDNCWIPKELKALT